MRGKTPPRETTVEHRTHSTAAKRGRTVGDRDRVGFGRARRHPAFLEAHERMNRGDLDRLERILFHRRRGAAGLAGDGIPTPPEPRSGRVEGEGMLRVLAAIRSLMEAGRANRGIVRPAAGRFPGAFVHPTADIDDDVVIGARTRIWHFSHILSHTRIGPDCSFGQNCCVGANVTVGRGCKIQNNVSLYDGVTLEDEVFCGPSCVFTNVLTPRAAVERKNEFLPTLVRRGASIGANATVVCGTTLGRYCLVGAGAVVIRDVPDHALVVGNPARQIGWVSEAGERLGEDLVCPRTGERYEVTADGRLRKTASETR